MNHLCISPFVFPGCPDESNDTVVLQKGELNTVAMNEWMFEFTSFFISLQF